MLLYKLCPRGHELSPENMTWGQQKNYKGNVRIQGKCKQCHAFIQRRLYYERKYNTLLTHPIGSGTVHPHIGDEGSHVE